MALALAVAGCATVTPQKIPVDRLEYGQVVAESWKRQTLLNVVRMRYGDAPMFLDVSSIINSYSMGGKANARLELPSRIDPNIFEFGGWQNTIAGARPGHTYRFMAWYRAGLVVPVG